jgi:hypothetical protein
MQNNPLRDQFLTNFCCGHKEISCSMERVSGLREFATVKASEQGRWNEMVFGEESDSALQGVGKRRFRSVETVDRRAVRRHPPLRPRKSGHTNVCDAAAGLACRRCRAIR